MPKRLFRFDGARWVKVEDDVRMTMSNTDTRNTYKTGFINNQDKTYFDKTLSDTFYILAPLSSAPTETVNEYRSPVTGVKFTTFNVNEEKGTGVLVKTSVDFVNDYSIKAFLNEVNVKTTVSKTDTNTVQFTIDNVSVSVGDRVDWSVYRQQINQRQSLSKALKPEADL
jgi:alpha-D-ribose 1-methylphosphonate 5-phosphate C-P lyase